MKDTFYLIFPLLLFAVIALLLCVLYLWYLVKSYKKTAYYQTTGLPYFSMCNDAGRHGEYLMYKSLSYMETTGAKFLFNVYLPKGNGETTEIDMLMISHAGIFVFESKNYSGWIFGNENQKNWYQTLPSDRGRSHKEQFYNPVMQNKSHVKHLKEFFKVALPFYSVIVFSNRCTLKDVVVDSTDVLLLQRSSLPLAIGEIHNATPTAILNNQQIARMYEVLYPYTQVDAAARAKHVSTIQNNTQKRVPPLNNTPLRCPHCGGTLVLRTAKTGARTGSQFYGCSNYPKCRYVKSIE